MKKCGKCGKKYADDIFFCPYCGVSVTEAAQEQEMETSAEMRQGQGTATTTVPSDGATTVGKLQNAEKMRRKLENLWWLRPVLLMALSFTVLIVTLLSGVNYRIEGGKFTDGKNCVDKAEHVSGNRGLLRLDNEREASRTISAGIQ